MGSGLYGARLCSQPERTECDVSRTMHSLRVAGADHVSERARHLGHLLRVGLGWHDDERIELHGVVHHLTGSRKANVERDGVLVRYQRLEPYK